MERRSGLMAEVLASLALVMSAATGVLAVVLVSYHEETLRSVLSAGLALEARSAAPDARASPARRSVPGSAAS